MLAKAQHSVSRASLELLNIHRPLLGNAALSSHPSVCLGMRDVRVPFPRPPVSRRPLAQVTRSVTSPSGLRGRCVTSPSDRVTSFVSHNSGVASAARRVGPSWSPAGRPGSDRGCIRPRRRPCRYQRREMAGRRKEGVCGGVEVCSWLKSELSGPFGVSSFESFEMVVVLSVGF